MKRILSFCFAFVITMGMVYSSQTESTLPEESTSLNTTSESDQKKLEDIYRDLAVPTFSYQHSVDPDQYYDMENTTWSPYPLLRLNSPLYFKNVVIEPGYYLLTPRKHDGAWYILFKEAGKVRHIIPAYDRGYTPETFYEDNIPEPKLDGRQKARKAVTDFVGKFKSSKRPIPKQSFLEVNDLENSFLQMIIYWGDFRYYTIFRTVPL